VIVFAAVDLQEGEVVQLVGGRAENTRVRWPDPVAVAQKWEKAGFAALHVVDLDAARGTGSNFDWVKQIIESVMIPVQVGGGVRDSERAHELIAAGAARVISGTRALEDPAWLEDVATELPQRVVVATDVKNGTVLTRGWTQETPLQLAEAVTRLNDLPLAAVLITDVGREGQLTGVDEAMFQSAIALCRHPVYAAGGIAGPSDLAVLRRAGAGGAVLGMSLYTGAIDPTQLQGETGA
jgi:phosphoribosylformimino-5-aminoimidazole carboxamide ribotide isomerase